MNRKQTYVSLAVVGTGMFMMGASDAHAAFTANAIFTNTSQIDTSGTVLAAGNYQSYTNQGGFNSGPVPGPIVGITFDPTPDQGTSSANFAATAMPGYGAVTWSWTKAGSVQNDTGGTPNSVVAGTSSANAQVMLNGSYFLFGGDSATNDPSPGSITLGFTGLGANTAVNVQMFAYGNCAPVSPTAAPTITANGTLIGSWTNNQVSGYNGTGNGGYCEFAATTDGNGDLSILMQGTNTSNYTDAGLFSGIVISSAASAPVPEPASLSLLALGTVGLLARRRRRAH